MKKTINKFIELTRERKLIIATSFFYCIINLLIFSAMIISLIPVKIFSDFDTAYFWINEIMFTARQVTFIGCFVLLILMYIEKESE